MYFKFDVLTFIYIYETMTVKRMNIGFIPKLLQDSVISLAHAF